jgi:anti-sigma-K factor RskA
MTTNQDLHEQVAAYALDALDEDERRAYEAHLSGCARCRADLAGLTETAGALGLAAGAAEPPDGLRDRILAAAHEEGPSNVVSIGAHRRRRFAIAGVAAAVAAAALAIGLYSALSNSSPSPKLALSAPTAQGVTGVTASGFDDAPAGKTYELWVIEGGKPYSAGFFTGGETQVVKLTRPAPAGSTVAATLEPTGGSDAPTTKPLAPTPVSA